MAKELENVKNQFGCPNFGFTVPALPASYVANELLPVWHTRYRMGRHMDSVLRGEKDPAERGDSPFCS